MLGNISKFVKYKFQLLLLIYFLCSYDNLIAQKSVIRFQHYTADQGLSQNMIDCILKDHKGFMWFGTWNGLNRFDGYSFIVYKQNQHRQDWISNNFIHDLCEDKYGNIWAGTDDGICVYLYEKNKFICYKTLPNNILSISSDKINVLLCDSKGNIWIGNKNSGLDKLQIEGSNGRIRSIQHFKDNGSTGCLKGDNMFSIYEDKHGNIWIGTNRGLNKFDEAGNIFINFQNEIQNPNSLSDNNVQAIYEDKNGFLWIGTIYGLNRFEYVTQSFTRFYSNPENPYSLTHNTIRAITEDLNGDLIVGTLGGISIYDRRQNNFKNYSYKLNDPFGLNNEFVNCILADKEGNVWIGTEKGGINKYNVFQKKFEFFENEPGNDNSLSHNTINSIYEDNKNIWIGTAGGGLNKYIKRINSFQHYRHNPHNPNSLVNDFISSIYKDTRGNIWVGSWGGGLHKLTPKNESKGCFINYENDPADKQSLINTFISSIAEDKQGNLWIGTNGGLDRLQPENGKFDHLNIPCAGTRITRVGCLQFDLWNNLWVGTENGLYKIMPDKKGYINIKESSVKCFFNSPGERQCISGNYVTSICSGRDGSLWFGTYGNGLNKLLVDPITGDGNKFINYTESDGLSNNVIYGILEDNKGDLWLSTDNGLTKFDKKQFKNYYLADGLQSNQFYWSAYYKNEYGKMYFGGMNGLNAFYPESITDDNFAPHVTITDFKIYNRSMEVGENYNGRIILYKSIVNTDKIIIPYKLNEFSFEFSALHFNQPEKNEYLYKLEGFDNQWIQVNSKRRFASYTNLKGGDYVFEVKAANNDGKWSVRPMSIKITVIPPFWATWWFRSIFIALIILSIITYNRYRLYALERHKRKLEIMVKERTIKIEEQKEKLQVQAANLKESNFQLEERQFQIEGQKGQLEKQNVEILEQRDRLIDLNKKVQAANQNRLNFFTNISHEFRTPLTLIISPLEQLIREFKEDIKTSNKLILVNRNAQRLMHLINQLMDLRKIETGKMELKVAFEDIVKFIQNISQSFSSLASQRNIKFDIISDPNSIIVFFDRDKLENIIFNLLSNAFKFTPENGSISIGIYLKTNLHKNFPGVAILEKHFTKNIELKEYVEIKISDTGIGIDSDKLHDIFKRFYRVPTSAGNKLQGTGIGLSLTKELVKVHKGLLFVDSNPGIGSTFSIMLPVDEKYLQPETIEKVSTNEYVSTLDNQVQNLGELLIDDPVNQIEGRKINSENQSKLPLILLVEDNNDLLSFMHSNLEQFFNIICAQDGKKGIELAIKQIPDLIISDIMMPETDGITLCSVLKHDIHTSHIPIILLTARSSMECWIEGFEAGADDYIPKPFDTNILQARINNLLENRKRLRNLFQGNLITVPKEITTTRTDEQFLQRAIKIVEENLSRYEFGVQELVSDMCVSRSLLHKKLTAIVGQSANDFITSIRLKKSALLLTNNNMSISNIALEVGFLDPKYFTRCFKKYFGMPPSEYLIKQK